MCKGSNLADATLVKLKIPADLSSHGESYIGYRWIDSCIAPIVKALQEGGIDMRSSCCGHGKGDGKILLQDGRRLIIKGERNGIST